MTARADFAGLDQDALRRAGRMVVSVEGMWCASCALAVERVMIRTPGVTWAGTSFAGGSALIKWDSDRFSLDELLARVERIGYRLVPLIETDELERRIDDQARAVWLRLAVAVFFGMWSMLGSVALYMDSGLAHSPAGWWIALAACIAALPAVTYSAWDFYRAGWRTLLAGIPGMDALVSLGVLAACAMSAWRLFEGSAEVYVDTATMLVGFLLCGRLIELYARRRNSIAVNALRQAVPETVRRLAADGTFAEVSAAQASAGECVLVFAGERIAVDGVIVDGESDIDRSLVTGESSPVPVGPGSTVEAGCVNLSCPIQVRIEHPYGQRFIDRIGVRMLELFGAKSAVALQAERFARWLIPFALSLTALVFAYAYATSGDAIHSALRALSVLVAACPCAVGLALPLAYAASAASAARHGILFRDPASMEALAQAKEILFDKTGTLTAGKLEVAEVISASRSGEEVLQWAALAETGVAHPIAQAIREAEPAVSHSHSPAERQKRVRRHAQGTEWTSPDGANTVLVGASSWLESLGILIPAPPESRMQQGTRIEVALNGQWIGALILRDTVRADARAAVAAFQSAGLNARLVTGDAAGAAGIAAAAVGLEAQQVHAACRPEHKVDVVAEALKPAVFVGDGINDSLALAAADCGVAVQGASSAAVATAGVVIASGGLGSVVTAWKHARLTLRIVRQNLMFSMVYNVAVLSLAASGVVPPAAAAGAMLASSLSVLANAARLTRFRR